MREQLTVASPVGLAGLGARLPVNHIHQKFAMASLFPPSSGPLLPSFNSLLIKGHYHPSAPIHLSLSHTAQHADTQVLCLTSDRRRMQQALQDYDDNWLAINSGSGKIKDISSRIKLLSVATTPAHTIESNPFLPSYPPTPAHLCLLLSMLRVPQSSEDQHITSNVALERAPSMIILHELSWFFLPQEGDDDHCKWTISSYLTLLARAQALLSSFSGSIPDGFFDSQLNQLMLPLTKQPPRLYGFIREAQPPPTREPVAKYLAKFFDWIGTVHEENATLETDEAPSEKRRKRQLDLCQTNDKPSPMISWHWQEVIGPGDSPEAKGVSFVWDS
ncbi:hypothetical protein BD779DRAFT_1465552 [Infundibulicybe gibba]|nr:hypothetical protein BD779DRAFT_1465552 [Infundibulicybe gibba]